jgi:hypothetical protein
VVVGELDRVVQELQAVPGDRIRVVLLVPVPVITGGLQPQINDLIYLAAEYAAGLALSRQRHLVTGRAWPLTGLLG